MPFQNHPDGLYLLKQPSEKNGIAIEHYGVLDIGNVLGHSQLDGSHPVVIHQTPPQIKIDWLKDTGKWHVMGKVIDLAGAKQRLREAFKNPSYDLFGNNCEHFARFITQNQHTSNQVFWGLVGTAVVGVLAYNMFKELE